MVGLVSQKIASHFKLIICCFSPILAPNQIWLLWLKRFGFSWSVGYSHFKLNLRCSLPNVTPVTNFTQIEHRSSNLQDSLNVKDISKTHKKNCRSKNVLHIFIGSELMKSILRVSFVQGPVPLGKWPKQPLLSNYYCENKILLPMPTRSQPQLREDLFESMLKSIMHVKWACRARQQQRLWVFSYQ